MMEGVWLAAVSGYYTLSRGHCSNITPYYVFVSLTIMDGDIGMNSCLKKKRVGPGAGV